MVSVFLTASPVVPATASTYDSGDTIATLYTDDGALNAIRIELYEAYGWGMTFGGRRTGAITGGDILINVLSGYPTDDFATVWACISQSHHYLRFGTL